MTDAQNSIRVSVDSEGRQASLVIPKEFTRKEITVALCELLLRQRQVEITPAVQQSLKQLEQSPPPDGETATVVVAQAIEPVQPRHGTVELLASAQQPAPTTNGEAQGIDFYNVSSFVQVKVGQVVGRILPPEPGQDGRDVLGRTIRAPLPLEAKLTPHDSILVDHQGQLVAQVEGVLVWSPPKVFVNAILETPGDVDFSTGNIDFNGDVCVRGGVCDRFNVSTTGRLVVHGVIGRANIRAGSDLVAMAGVNGDEQSSIVVGGSLTARYLMNVNAQIENDLQFERAVMNCGLIVGGRIKAPNGSIIGGLVQVAGEVELGSLGSDAAVKTRLSLGDAARLRQLADQLAYVCAKLDEMKNVLLQEQAPLKMPRAVLTPADKERLTEINFELEGILSKLARAQAGAASVNEQIRARTTVDLRVNRDLFPGAQLIVDNMQYSLFKRMRGPVRIIFQRRTLIYHGTSGAWIPMQQVATISPVANGPSEKLQCA